MRLRFVSSSVSFLLPGRYPTSEFDFTNALDPMAANLLTDVEVRAFRAPPNQRLEVFDVKARGLCLRVTAQKVMEFCLSA